MLSCRPFEPNGRGDGRYAGRMMFPGLVCRECREDFVLPYRRFVDSAAVEPYWPLDRENLPWVCDQCHRYSLFTIQELRSCAQPRASVLSERGFWRVEIPCSVSGCAASVIAYTQTFGQTSQRVLGLIIASAHPTPCCRFGHTIDISRCYPRRLDFVEWNGPEEHVS